MWTEAQRVETEAIACQLDGLERRAEGSELRSIAFLIDIALSEARDELARSPENPGERLCRQGSFKSGGVKLARK